MVKLNFASNFSFGFCKSFAPVRYINLYQYQRAEKESRKKIVAESNRVWWCVGGFRGVRETVLKQQICIWSIRTAKTCKKLARNVGMRSKCSTCNVDVGH